MRWTVSSSTQTCPRTPASSSPLTLPRSLTTTRSRVSAASSTLTMFFAPPRALRYFSAFIGPSGSRSLGWRVLGS